MARKKAQKPKIVRRKAYGLNIVINPHPDGRYVELFQAAVKNKIERAFFGMRSGRITWFRKEPGSDNLYRGIIAIFSSVNFDRAWLNTETGDEAAAYEVAIVSIPKILKPEFQKIPFVFDSKRHRMVYLATGLGVNSARSLIEGLFKDNSVTSASDDLSVTIVQDSNALDKMLSERGIKKIEIEINLPNADDLAEAEKELFDSLKNQKAKGFRQTIEADSSNNLVPDEETKTLGEIALTNGKVTTKVQEGRGTVERSTKSFPKMRLLSFEPLNMTEFDALFDSLKHF